MKFVIIFFTKEPKAPEVYYLNEIEKLLARIVELTSHKAKFTVYEIGRCVGDFS